MFQRIISITALIVVLLSAGVLGFNAKAQGFARGEVSVGGQRFEVEIARTDGERSQGLMFRRFLPANAGMLFDFEQTRSIAMWMKNTFIPLDMLFIDEAGEVVYIAERTVPKSLATISAPQPVRYVLELNGGTADRLGLSVGDRVEGLPR